VQFHACGLNHGVNICNIEPRMARSIRMGASHELWENLPIKVVPSFMGKQFHLYGAFRIGKHSWD
jgi:hypothetical protein